MTAEDVVFNNIKASMCNLPLRDPDTFVPGGIHECVQEWEKLDISCEISDWLLNGVDLHKFLRHFKGNFKGMSYDSDKPPSIYLQNSSSCENFKFIEAELTHRLENGSLILLGRVGEVDPPHLVLPLTVEPTKPRLCHDERFLNLWIKDCPFNLETLRDVPRLFNRDGFMTSIDDKSGYDHVLLSESSRTYFGIQFGGYYMVYRTLPFGFKSSAFIISLFGYGSYRVL